MIQVNVHEAKSQLSRLIEATLAGEKVTIARSGRPVVDLVVHSSPPVVIGVPGWADAEVDTDALDAPDQQIDALFAGADE
ncbi:type II toxin-antitoxin system Phd/YefM family antitoxin [Serinicoccus profundi]|uniref:type II toxin-antitoxin system Phd/YefM family antitoxin n=1 Tax=Serinicoccus profundi TaxID=1078471 RepID=UPI000255E781|nr:prevent-host-death protein [Serinicoccus profundi]